MKFLRPAEYSLLDHKHIESIAEELQVTPIMEYLEDYRRNWFQHVNRMQRSRLLKHILACNTYAEGEHVWVDHLNDTGRP